jgi:primosomal protein N' (replication factor Y)
MELQHRRERAAPPFAALARVIVRSASEQQSHQEAVNLAERFRSEIARLKLPIKLIGPAPCPIMRLRSQHRFHFQMSTATAETYQILWREVARQIKLPEGVEFVMDVDPLDMR